MNAADLLKYANIQMAAEAVKLPQSGAMTVDDLVNGNTRASKFTETGAAEFLTQGWRVVSQSGDMGSGFNGTLFTNGAESVLSFRSTEFAGDDARDNIATNSLEIFEKGYAIGQPADMKAWFESIQGGITQPLTVTGCRLGGQAVTALEWPRESRREHMDIPSKH